MQTLPRANLKVLIVDDDPTTRLLLREALEGRGARVRASASACEAERALAAWQPDVMISDVGMPRENGYDLIRHVRHLPPEQGGRTPAIACTGYAGAENRARAMHAGFDELVPKPVDLENLIATIAHVAGVRETGSASGDEGPALPDSSAAGGPPPRTSAPDS